MMIRDMDIAELMGVKPLAQTFSFCCFIIYCGVAGAPMVFWLGAGG